ncbi:MAG: dockerin type I repeat-containing protein [Bacteroidaceae bacterium]|nr:dockerin type I repeat-containing protein [Bacteroidaceae bacterium]
MKRKLTLICLSILSLAAMATDYTTLLTPDKGFTEVTSFEGMIAGKDFYYILTSAENTELLVGVGAYEAKPGWALEDTKALRYILCDEASFLDPLCYFTIEDSAQYIGLRSIVYSADLFQTHDGAGFMYVNTFTDKTLDEWSCLIPTRAAGDYWLFESGKYPLSGGNYYSGYLGPWNNTVDEGEALALNRKNTQDDEAGHFRLFRIAKADFEAQYREMKRQQLFTASSSNLVDATWLITNPSFETGDITGWTMTPPEEIADGIDIGVRDHSYPLSGKEGGYLGNSWCWWSGVAIEQTIGDVPDGIYEISGVVATWEGYTVNFYANDAKTSVSGQGDGVGIRLSHSLTVGPGRRIVVGASRTDVDWWSPGRENEQNNRIGFLKLDDVRLTCKGVYFSGTSLPLPNDNTTLLSPNQWYYYEVIYPSEYLLFGNIEDMVYTTDGVQFVDEVDAQDVQHSLSLPKGRVYFKTSRSDATLLVSMEREVNQGSVTAAALNVDGLPASVSFVDINPDGPGASGTKLISKYLALKGYDFIGISEDFEYHSELTQNLSGYSWGVHRGSVSASVLISPANTDGLEFAWKTDKVSAENESWTQWTSTTSTDGNQYIKKGYRHYDVTLAENVVVDVYVLHMDAGDEALSSREAQWRQLAAAVNAADASRPKLIVGDTNSRWTREDIKTNFVDLLPRFSVCDAWVEMCRDGIYPTTDMGDLTDNSDPLDFSKYEVVDKILYLNPVALNSLQLIPENFRVERDYIYATVQENTDNGTPLGDHNPVVVEFSYVWAGDVKTVPGDVNGDKEVSVSDVTALVSIILGADSSEPYQYDHLAADVNKDGTITVSDVTALVSIILGN